MGFLGLFGNYDKPGPGVNKDEPPKAAPVRFFEILFRKFTKLVQLNLIFIIPTLVALALMFLLYMVPFHFIVQLQNIVIDGWATFVVPLPLVLLSPFTAGLTLVTRNFAREEHAFVWSDFWDAVKGNWKYFLINGFLCYSVFTLLGFAILYYYSMAGAEWLNYIPCWICLVVAIIFLFAQFYLPMMFVTFDLKFSHAYKNAMIFTIAGFGRNIFLTLIMGVLVFVIISVPMLNITVLILFLLFAFFIFAFFSYLINFTIYPIINGYLIEPYQKMQKEKEEAATKGIAGEDFSGLFAQLPEEEEDENEEEKYVYVNGKLVKKSELNKKPDKSIE